MRRKLRDFENHRRSTELAHGISRRQIVAGMLALPSVLRAAPARITNLTADGAVNNPYGLRIGPDGALCVCEIGNHRVSRIDVSTGARATVVDGQKEPYELQFDPEGNLLFVDMPAHSVRIVERKTGAVRTVAGTGEPGFSGDGGAATAAQLKQPHSIAFHPDGRLLICDIGNHRIRRVDLRKNVIDTFAGTGEREATPDGAPLQGTALNGPRAIDFNADGDLFLVLREGNVVLRAAGGRFHHVAGTGEKGYTGDGGDAKRAKLSGPKGISCARDGSVYIADTESHTIRRIDAKGVISTVAGTGERGDGPAGDPLRCQLSRPHGVYAARDGKVYIADSESHRIRVLA
jgi:DNA-binding beta-propeller fold protein YncE